MLRRLYRLLVGLLAACVLVNAQLPPVPVSPIPPITPPPPVTPTPAAPAPTPGAPTPVPTFVPTPGVLPVVPTPVDCVMSQWSGYTSCSAICGGGLQTRTRSVVTEPSGGTPCPTDSKGVILLTETRACNTHNCAPAKPLFPVMQITGLSTQLGTYGANCAVTSGSFQSTAAANRVYRPNLNEFITLDYSQCGFVRPVLTVTFSLLEIEQAPGCSNDQAFIDVGGVAFPYLFCGISQDTVITINDQTSTVGSLLLPRTYSLNPAGAKATIGFRSGPSVEYRGVELSWTITDGGANAATVKNSAYFQGKTTLSAAVGDDLYSSSHWVVEFWMKPMKAPAEESPVLSIGDCNMGTGIEVNLQSAFATTVSVVFRLNKCSNAYLDDKVQIPLNVWTHVYILRNGTFYQFGLNGLPYLKPIPVIPLQDSVPNTVLYLGGGALGENFFVGFLDLLRLYVTGPVSMAPFLRFVKETDIGRFSSLLHLRALSSYQEIKGLPAAQLQLLAWDRAFPSNELSFDGPNPSSCLRFMGGEVADTLAGEVTMVPCNEKLDFSCFQDLANPAPLPPPNPITDGLQSCAAFWPQCGNRLPKSTGSCTVGTPCTVEDCCESLALCSTYSCVAPSRASSSATTCASTLCHPGECCQEDACPSGMDCSNTCASNDPTRLSPCPDYRHVVPGGHNKKCSTALVFVPGLLPPCTPQLCCTSPVYCVNFVNCPADSVPTTHLIPCLGTVCTAADCCELSPKKDNAPPPGTNGGTDVAPTTTPPQVFTGGYRHPQGFLDVSWTLQPSANNAKFNLFFAPGTFFVGVKSFCLGFSQAGSSHASMDVCCLHMDDQIVVDYYSDDMGPLTKDASQNVRLQSSGISFSAVDGNVTAAFERAMLTSDVWDTGITTVMLLSWAAFTTSQADFKNARHLNTLWAGTFVGLPANMPSPTLGPSQIPLNCNSEYPCGVGNGPCSVDEDMISYCPRDADISEFPLVAIAALCALLFLLWACCHASRHRKWVQLPRGNSHGTSSNSSNTEDGQMQWAPPTWKSSFIVMFSFVMGILDFSSDVQFAFFLNTNKDDHVKDTYSKAYLVTGSWVFLVLPCLVNVVLVLRFMKGQPAEFWRWYLGHGMLCKLVVLVSCFQLKSMSLLFSNLLNLRAFRAPFSTVDKHRLRMYCLSNLLLEDMPQLVLQVMVYFESNTANILMKFSIATTVISLVIGLLERIFTWMLVDVTFSKGELGTMGKEMEKRKERDKRDYAEGELNMTNYKEDVRYSAERRSDSVETSSQEKRVKNRKEKGEISKGVFTKGSRVMALFSDLRFYEATLLDILSEDAFSVQYSTGPGAGTEKIVPALGIKKA